MRYSVLEYLEEAAINFGNKVAFIDQNKKITFAETKHQALCIANAISKLRNVRRTPILVYLPKSVECITAFMGILYSGNFYTPTDVRFPFPKVQSVLDVLNPSLIITDTQNKVKLLENGVSGDLILDINSVDYSVAELDSTDYLKCIISTDPVYTFFTSGSTGVPKGVIINNLSILDYIDWASQKFNIGTDTIMGNQSPFYFDISTQDIYTTLKCGATLVIIPEAYFIFPIKSLQFINEHNINYLYWVPSAFINVSKLDLLSEVSLPNVHTMIFGGEVMPVKHLNYWIKHVPSLKCIANVCGPTETTVNYSCYIVDRKFNDDEVLPLGSPIPNRELLLLDDNLKPVKEPNALGELYVRGIALSPGYYDNPDKTNEMYVQNPLNSLYPEKVYRTGDLAYYNERNELVYAGRKDFQIKHMGYRIELGEIEAAALSCSGITQSCCFYDKKSQQIILCYVGNSTPLEVKQFLTQKLPVYMIPKKYLVYEKFPYNDNGKIDRKLLEKSAFTENDKVKVAVTDYLDSTAKLYPNKIAFVSQDKNGGGQEHKVTFSELKTFSQRIASVLAKRKFFRVPVVVFMEKSVKAVTSFLGTAYAGCFYTPVDVDMPPSRVKKIFETLNPAVVITDESQIENVRRLSGNFEILLYEDLIESEADLPLLEKVSKKIIDTDVLYVLFTSGSTGPPKGVIIGHRSVMDYVDWVTETFNITSENTLGNQAPLYFDNSVLDIYVTLKTGATTYLIPRKNFAFPIRLLEFIRDKQINTIFWVPSLIAQIANLDLLDECDISCLHTIIFAGEVMPTKQLNAWRKRLPDATFTNLYGPTEITVDCTYYIVERDLEDTEPVPIGRPCRNSDILVLNENNELVTGQEQGELCVRGTSLAYGYYNDAEKTSKAFVQNPLNPWYPEKIYRTGDIVHYNIDGDLIFDGRKDFQIKHLGYRIELGEIELAVGSLEGVEMNCCIFDSDRDMIISIYSGKLTVQEMRQQLTNLLPSYMIPNKFIKVEIMPLNPNGKIDRNKLKGMYFKT